MLSTLVLNAGETDSNPHDSKTWLATYNNPEDWKRAWTAMADVLVERCLTNQYGVTGKREHRGWTLYLVTYGTDSRD